MKQTAIIGIDLGTTSTKAVAFDTTGKVLHQCSEGYPINSPAHNRAEQDPVLVFKAVLNTLRQVNRLLRQKGYTLVGVSFSSAMHSLIAMDADGNHLTNCIIWADTRSTAYADKLKNSDLGHQIYLRTGTPLHPMSPLPKLCWLREQEPELFARAVKFIGIKEYVCFRLFGKYKIDYSMASATGLFDIFTLKWHPAALQVAGVEPSRLSDPVPPTFIFRGLDASCASAMEFPDDVPFVIGASDGCLANLGANAVRPGDAVVTIGTSGAVRIMAGTPATDAKERIFSYLLTANHFVLGGAVNNGGIVLRWFRDNFYSKEAEAAAAHDQDLYAKLNEEAAKVPPGAEGLLFLPYLLGERSPIWDAEASACFFGVHLYHTKAHFLRALMEGVMYAIYSVGRALEQTTGPISTIYANGGFARSPFWVQLLADVFNKEVRLTETPEGSAFGAAVMGLHALGIIQKLEEVADMVTVTQIFTPDAQAHQCYQEKHARFEKLYQALKDSF